MSRSVGRPTRGEMVKFSYWRVTEKQHKLLTVLAETGSVDQAVKSVGSTKYKLGLMLATPEGKEPSAFVKAYDHVMAGLARDFDYSKVKNLSTLKGVIEDMQESMMKKVELKAVIDLSKPADEEEQLETEEAEYEELSEDYSQE